MRSGHTENRPLCSQTLSPSLEVIMKKNRFIIPIISGAATAAAAVAFTVKGRRFQPGLEALDGWLYAHRGFHREPDAPENSLAAFRLAVSHGYGAELDVHLLSDGNLAVIHDSHLKRMTGKNGVVESLTEAQLPSFTLGNSSECIPTLRQILSAVDGRVPLIIELKPWKGNDARLCRRVFKELDHYQGAYCVESFQPQVLWWLRRHRPNVIRGQLASNYFKEHKGLGPARTVFGTFMTSNFLTRPDFVAYRFSDRKHPANQFCMKAWKMRGAAWTIHNAGELEQARREGYWPIFENFDPENGKRFEGAMDT